MPTSYPSSSAAPRLPPRWFIRFAWRAHRALYRVSRGRLGLREPRRGGHAGMMRLRTTGRRSGQERAVIVDYFEDGGELVTLAMNGWGAADPAWWLNLRATPEAEVDLRRGSRRVTARAATPDERARLWAKFREYPGWGDVDAFSQLRERERPVVILAPRP
ncbi:nitroreductase family deazaflavin-dependent oxidoreductase [Glaciihabitans tibetensis]|uniref:nitroreductase family deazaflavin-dependent oxidoreductase n=1 Tax=Glaciihabitans tibetensis TaxID=1266600 RepID=UPI000D07B5DD|nr:nitroreductase family deazaflavin-dependent oxidoreductase [Glaciihabitans tibetensis]